MRRVLLLLLCLIFAAPPVAVAKPRAKRASKARGKRAAKGRRGKRTRGSGKRARGSGKRGQRARRHKGRKVKRGRGRRGATKRSSRATRAADRRMARRCRQKRHRRTRACRAWQKKRKEAARRRRLARKCRKRRYRRTRACIRHRRSVARERKARRICGGRRARARRRDTVARMARRYRISQATFRRYNRLSRRTRRLRRGRWYVVHRSPYHNTRLHGGVLLSPVPGVLKIQRPARGWGKPLLVDSLRTAAATIQRGAPLRPHLIFGDLSKKGGGCLPPHKSHRGGLDVDIGYYYLGGRQRGWLDGTTSRDLDADRTWSLLGALLATGRLQYAFIDYSLQPALYAAALRAGWTVEQLRPVFQVPRPKSDSHVTVIRHLSGHADHMHLRMRCQDAACQLTDTLRVALVAAASAPRGGPVGEHGVVRHVGERRRRARRRRRAL